MNAVMGERAAGGDDLGAPWGRFKWGDEDIALAKPSQHAPKPPRGQGGFKAQKGDDYTMIFIFRASYKS
jgi:hypothetical protein